MPTLRMKNEEIDKINQEVIQLRDTKQRIIPLLMRYQDQVQKEKYLVHRHGQYKPEAWMQLFQLKEAVKQLININRRYRTEGSQALEEDAYKVISEHKASFVRTDQKTKQKYIDGSPYTTPSHEEVFLEELRKVVRSHCSGEWVQVFGGRDKMPVGPYIPDVLCLGLVPSQSRREAFMENGHSGRFFGTVFEVGNEALHSCKAVKDDTMRAVLEELGFDVIDIDNSLINLNGTPGNRLKGNLNALIRDLIGQSVKGTGRKRVPVVRPHQRRAVLADLQKLAIAIGGVRKT